MRTLAFLVLGCFVIAAQDPTQRAAQLYHQTDYQGSLQALAGISRPDAAIYSLRGKNYFMLGDFKNATESFEKAIALAPTNSEFMLWLGRTYGRRAETNWLTAGPNASRARQCFEKAVALNPHDPEAVNDLFDYYLNAPGFLGGGADKAEAIANRIREERPAEYHYDEALLAERKKQYAAAEEHYRRAIELAPNQVGRVIDLARYLAKRGRLEESDAVYAQAEKMAPHDPRVLFARAKNDIENHRNLEHARMLLREYLESQITPDDPPKQVAEELLRRAAGE